MLRGWMFLFLPTLASGQVSSTNLWPRPWVKTFGGTGTESVHASSPGRTNGFFLCGETNSFGQGAMDAWVVRLGAAGNTVWEQAIGGPSAEEAAAILGTGDGGCLVAGATKSSGAGGADGWLVKFNKSGDVEWQSTYGGPQDERFSAVALSPDGYYVGGTIKTASAEDDVWVLLVSKDGQVQWQKQFPGIYNDRLRSLASTPDGLIFTADSRSSFTPGLLTVPTVPFFRPWVVKLNDKGNVQWSRTYDISGGDAWSHIIPTKDGGYAVTGEAFAMAFFRGDVWIVRLDSQGNVLWSRQYGDNFGVTWVDSGAQLRETRDGGFVVAGSTGTAGAGSDDLWLLRVDSSGNLLWDHTYGGPGFDNGTTVTLTSRQHILIAGLVQQSGPLDAIALHLDPDGSAGNRCDLTSPTSPVSYSSALSVRSVQPTSVPTLVVATPSAAIQKKLDTGGFLCPPQ